MSNFTPAQQRKALALLVLFHLVIIASSNYLVQLPFTIFGMHTTWGAFTFPFIFLATDLTVRIFGAQLARKIIFLVMLPALAVSYFLSVVFFEGQFQGFSHLGEFNLFVARIAAASFMAYLLGQILDVHVFNRLRQLKHGRPNFGDLESQPAGRHRRPHRVSEAGQPFQVEFRKRGVRASGAFSQADGHDVRSRWWRGHAGGGGHAGLGPGKALDSCIATQHRQIAGGATSGGANGWRAT